MPRSTTVTDGRIGHKKVIAVSVGERMSKLTRGSHLLFVSRIRLTCNASRSCDSACIILDLFYTRVFHELCECAHPARGGALGKMKIMVITTRAFKNDRQKTTSEQSVAGRNFQVTYTARKSLFMTNWVEKSSSVLARRKSYD